MNKNKTIKMKKSALSGAILWALGTAQAATINVTGSCTLIDAIEAANTDTATGSCPAGSGNDTIVVVNEDSNITINTIFESSTGGPGDVGLPIISSNITIEGNGLTINANNSTDNFRLFEVDSSGDLTLRDTTVSGADDGFGYGSGLLSYGGRVTLSNTTFSRNNGAIRLANSFNNEILNSTIRHNIGTDYFGGLMTSFAEVDIVNSGIVNNKLDFGFILRNGDFGRGSGGPVIAGGASFYQSTVTLSNSTVSGNESFYGGGLSITSMGGSPLLKSNSPMRGVIQNNVTLTNSTVTDNRAFGASGILNVASQGSLTLQGSIIAGNKDQSPGGFAPNIYNYLGVVNVDAHNIIGEMGDAGVYNVTLGASDQTFDNATEDNLYPLTLTNGQLTHPLKLNSVAIDGNDLSCYGSIVDQEGKGRGIDGDSNDSFVCDIGAIEHSLPIMADDAPCDLTSAIISANNDASVGGCQPGNGHDIIILPENSTQSIDTIQGLSPFTYLGLPLITSAITLEGQGSLIERATTAVDDFDLLMSADGGHLNLIDSTVTGANGNFGAVSSLSGNVKVINSTLTANQSTGLFDAYSINSGLFNSTVNNNAIQPGSFVDNFSSGVVTYGSVGFSMNRSTIDYNSGGFVGGLDMRYVVQGRIENSTISNNAGTYYGGVIVAGGDNQLSGLTITGNAGSEVGGMLVAPSGALTPNRLSHSIVSGNMITPPPPIAGELSRGGDKQGLINLRGAPGPTRTELLAINNSLAVDDFNIFGQNGDSGTDGVTLGSSDMVPAGATNTVIDTNLADNGGDTLTHLPVPGGIAVDGGADICGLRQDQRGFIRPWDDKCDVGAVESESVASSDLIFKDGFDAQIIIRRK
jgi:hypothetical protein